MALALRIFSYVKTNWNYDDTCFCLSRLIQPNRFFCTELYTLAQQYKSLLGSTKETLNKKFYLESIPFSTLSF